MSKKSNKNYCLIVDPVVSGGEICQELLKKNFSVIAYKSGIFIQPDMYEARFAKFPFEAVFSTLDQEVIEALSKYNLHRVISGYEGSMDIADRLADMFCPRYANSPSTSIYRTNKYFMQEALKLADLPVIPQIIVDDEVLTQTQQSEIASWGFPVFIKPTCGGASVGVKRCNSIAEVVSYLHLIMSNKSKYFQEFVIQKYITGEEYFVDTISLDAHHKIVGVYKYVKKLFQGVPTYCYAEIVDPYSEVGIKSIEFVKQVLDVLGFYHGAAHTEIFITEHDPYLIELNPRVSGGGGFINKLATITTGLNQFILLSESIDDPKKFLTLYCHPARLQKRGRVLILHSWKTKSFDKFNEAAIQGLPSYIEHRCLKSKGDQLTPPKDLMDCVAYVLLAHENQEQIEQDSQYIFELEEQGGLF